MFRTGSLGLDILLGGGWKPGTINEIWGEPGSGKTTLAQATVWELDGEKAMWMSLGTEVPHRPSGAYLAQPKSAEQAFWIMETCVRGDVRLVVVDSANGLIRQAELDGDPDYVPDEHREYKDELNGLKEAVKGKGAVVLFLSKPRDRDRAPIRGTGISEKARDRVKLKIWHEKQNGSRLIQATLPSREGQETLFEINPGTGIDWAGEMAALAVKTGVASHDGSWINYQGETFHGFRKFRERIFEDISMACELDESVRSAAGIM